MMKGLVRFRREAQAVSDIDTAAVDCLKALDPNGRLENGHAEVEKGHIQNPTKQARHLAGLCFGSPAERLGCGLASAFVATSEQASAAKISRGDHADDWAGTGGTPNDVSEWRNDAV